MLEYKTTIANTWRFQSYEAKCVQLGCFRRGVDLSALKILPGQGYPPATILD